MLRKIIGYSALFCLFLSTGYSFETLFPEEIIKLPTLPLRLDADIHNWELKMQSPLGMGVSRNVLLSLESITDQACLKEISLYTSTNKIVILSVTSYRDEPRLQTLLREYDNPLLPNQWVCRNDQNISNFLMLLRRESLMPKSILDVFSTLLGIDKYANHLMERS